MNASKDKATVATRSIGSARYLSCQYKWCKWAGLLKLLVLILNCVVISFTIGVTPPVLSSCCWLTPRQVQDNLPQGLKWDYSWFMLGSVRGTQPVFPNFSILVFTLTCTGGRGQQTPILQTFRHMSSFTHMMFQINLSGVTQVTTDALSVPISRLLAGRAGEIHACLPHGFLAASVPTCARTEGGPSVVGPWRLPWASLNDQGYRATPCLLTGLSVLH